MGAFDTAASFICDAALHLLYRAKPLHSFRSLASLRRLSCGTSTEKSRFAKKKGGISKQKAIKEVARFAAGGI